MRALPRTFLLLSGLAAAGACFALSRPEVARRAAPRVLLFFYGGHQQTALVAAKALALCGSAEGAYLVSVLYAQPWPGRDSAKVFAWALRAAERGSDESRVAVANYYLFGYGVTADPAQAERWLTLAAQDSRPDLHFRLGMYYATGRFPGGAPKAVPWLLRAAAAGHARARVELARLSSAPQ